MFQNFFLIQKILLKLKIPRPTQFIFWCLALMYGVGWLTAIKESQGEFFLFQIFCSRRRTKFSRSYPHPLNFFFAQGGDLSIILNYFWVGTSIRKRYDVKVHCTKMTKMGVDSLAENTQNAPKFICPIVQKSKSSEFQWKKASVGVRSPWIKLNKWYFVLTYCEKILF